MTYMPLASWLLSPWRHAKPEGYSTVVRAAQALDQAIWDKHGFKLMYIDDPARFRDVSEKEVERATRGVIDPEDEPDYPQLGMHTDATCRAMSSDDFFALIGCVTERPLRCITMNTAALYDDTLLDRDEYIEDLFTRRRLWSDHPDRDCAGLVVETTTWTVDVADETLPAVHLGTAWVHPWRRRQGIMARVSRLHRMVAYLRFGAVPQFGTVVPGAHPFGGRDIGSVIETRNGFSKESRVLFYAAEDILADAAAVMSEPTPPATDRNAPVRCGCRQCRRDRKDMIGDLPAEAAMMIVCAKCGNKRCPHATDHRLACTDSNEPGQAGSAYA